MVVAITFLLLIINAMIVFQYIIIIKIEKNIKHALDIMKDNDIVIHVNPRKMNIEIKDNK